MVSILLLYYGRKSKQSYERYLPARTSGGPELPDSVTCVFSSTSHGTEGIRAVGFRMAYTETHAGARYHTLNASLLPQRINRATGVNPWDNERASVSAGEPRLVAPQRDERRGGSAIRLQVSEPPRCALRIISPTTRIHRFPKFFGTHMPEFMYSENFAVQSRWKE